MWAVLLIASSVYAGNVCKDYRGTEFGLPCQPQPSQATVLSSAEAYLLGEDRPLGGIDTLCTRPTGTASTWKEDPVFRIVPKYVAMQDPAKAEAFFAKLGKQSAFRGAFVRAVAEKDPARRLALVDEALAASPDNVGALTVRARALLALGRHADAVHAFESAVRAHEQQHAEALKRHEDQEEWRNVLDERLSDIRTEQAELFYAIDRFGDAADVFDKTPLFASSLTSDSDQHALHAIYANARAGRADHALLLAGQYRQATAEEALGHLAMSYAQAAKGDVDAAMASMRGLAKALQKFPAAVHAVEVDLDKEPLYEGLRDTPGWREVVSAVAAVRAKQK